MTFSKAIQRFAIALMAAGILSLPAGAHPGHDKPISQQEAVQRGGAEITRLVESAKLERSWIVENKLVSAELRAKGSAKEWALVFSNAKAADSGKHTLYVFLSESGEYLAANFTGR